MINAITIDINPDIRSTTRKIYSLANWYGEMGGLLAAFKDTILFLLPFLRNQALEVYLITKLFRTAGEKITPPEENNDNGRKLLIMS